jgi:bacterioferritin
MCSLEPGESSTKGNTTMSKSELTSTVQELRARARKNLADGAMTPNYGGDVTTAIKMLNDALATELTCVLRYKFHYVAAQGLDSEAVKDEFLQHANEEQAHADRIAERINQLGGKANLDPATFAARSATEYREGENLVDMIKEDLIAERIAVEHYRELVRYFGEKDPSTRRMLEDILAQEEEHANDMHDLLVAHEGSPSLPK